MGLIICSNFFFKNLICFWTPIYYPSQIEAADDKAQSPTHLYIYLKLLLMEVVNIKRQEKASLIFHVSTHALAGPLESLQAVICNLYYASSPEKKGFHPAISENIFFRPYPFYWSTHSNFHLNEFHCDSVGHVKCLILSFDRVLWLWLLFQSDKKLLLC